MSNIDGFAFAPARLMERLVGFLVGIAARGFFRKQSEAVWQAGAKCFVISIALLAALEVTGVTALPLFGSLSHIGRAIALVIAAVLGQFIAVRFCNAGESIVAGSSMRASNVTVFQLLGLLTMAAGLAIGGWNIVTGLRYSDPERVLGGAATLGGIVTIGFLFFSTDELSIRIDGSASAGEDGVAIFGAYFKALLAANRLVSGGLSVIGGLAIAGGIIGGIADKWGSVLWVYAGLTVLAVACIYPLLTYLFSVLYFTIVDALLGLIFLARQSR